MWDQVGPVDTFGCEVARWSGELHSGKAAFDEKRGTTCEIGVFISPELGRGKETLCTEFVRRDCVTNQHKMAADSGTVDRVTWRHRSVDKCAQAYKAGVCVPGRVTHRFVRIARLGSRGRNVWGERPYLKERKTNEWSCET